MAQHEPWGVHHVSDGLHGGVGCVTHIMEGHAQSLSHQQALDVSDGLHGGAM